MTGAASTPGPIISSAHDLFRYSPPAWNLTVVPFCPPAGNRYMAAGGSAKADPPRHNDTKAASERSMIVIRDCPPKTSFPNSVWERTSWKLRFHDPRPRCYLGRPHGATSGKRSFQDMRCQTEFGNEGRCGHSGHSNSSMTLPPLTMATGRPSGVWNSSFGLIPTKRYMVAARSSGPHGSLAGFSARASDLPITRPPLIPPPPSSTVNAGPQWSRPAFLLIRGVRPNSPVTTTSVVSRSPRSARSRNSIDTPVSNCGRSVSFNMRKLLSCVSQLLWSMVTHRTPASTRRRAIKQHCPSECRPYAARRFSGSAAMSNALLASGDIISSNAFFWNSPTASAFRLSFPSSAFGNGSRPSRRALRLSSRAAGTLNGGSTSGTLKSGAFGSASIPNGAAAAPRYAGPPLGWTFGKQTYGGTDPRGPSF